MDTEPLLDLRDALKTHVDRFRMHGFKSGKPAGQRGGKSLHDKR